MAGRLLATIKPDVILSFGGFAAFPVVFIGWVMGIPVVVHEQTMTVGRANKFSVPLAKKIAVARKEGLKHFPSSKAVVTGNPIMTQIAEIMPKTKLGTPPTIFVTGGSRGSTTINELIKPLLPKLLQKYVIIHQTGQLDFGRYREIQETLPAKLKGNYEVYSLIDPMQIDGVYKRADLLIGRSGANTCSETLALHLPSIFIPLPFAYQDEQTKNAGYAKKTGLAEVLPQPKATAGRLLELIEKTVRDWEKITARAKNIESLDKKASSKLVDLVLGELPN
jgi:UDP-N-acetylglucosamine--N-acetylmuramyl-(pentapeptide) pyrophosphoryl-undecaprenol N-acetylglucosamine transferase